MDKTYGDVNSSGGAISSCLQNAPCTMHIHCRLTFSAIAIDNNPVNIFIELIIFSYMFTSISI